MLLSQYAFPFLPIQLRYLHTKGKCIKVARGNVISYAVCAQKLIKNMQKNPKISNEISYLFLFIIKKERFSIEFLIPSILMFFSYLKKMYISNMWCFRFMVPRKIETVTSVNTIKRFLQSFELYGQVKNIIQRKKPRHCWNWKQ